MKSYRNYKNTKIDWIGEIPEQWEIKKMKYVVSVRNSNVDKKSKEGEKLVLLCNYVDVYKNEYITKKIKFMMSTTSDQNIERFTLHDKDVIITKDSETPDDIGIAAIVKEEIKNLICGYHLTLLKPEGIYGDYLFRLLQNESSRQYFEAEARGVTRYGLSLSSIEDFLCLLPPIDEQSKIASFLEYKTSLIDKLISINEKKIKLLEEKKEATINQAVTKGLDPNAKMKDSGIAWIGEIPKNWEIVQINRVAGGFNNGISGNQNDYVTEFPISRIETISGMKINPGKVKYISSSEVKHNYLFKLGDILLSHINSFERVGNCAIYEGIPNNLIHGVNTIRISPCQRTYPQYLLYLLQSRSFQYSLKRVSKHAINQVSVPTAEIKQIHIPFCNDYNEQQQIVSILSKYIANTNLMTLKLRNQNQLLKEYRQTLISNVVTGKIDVRDEKIPKEFINN